MDVYKKVQKTLSDWVDALAQEELEEYKAFYSPNFLAGRDDLTTKRWLDTWHAQTGGEHLHTTNTSIQFYDDKLARVSLVLHNYLPDGVALETHKDLLMEEEDGDWKIRVEVDTKTQTVYERPSLPAVASSRVRDQRTPSTRTQQRTAAARGFLYYASVTLAVVLLTAFTASYFYTLGEKQQPVVDVQDSSVSTSPLAKAVPGPAPVKQASSPEPVDRDAVAQMLNAWTESVANKDFDRYLSFYSDNFFKHDPGMRKKWEQAIEKVIVRPGPVKASVRQFELIPHQDNRAVDVVLKQDYDVEEKTYLLEKNLTLESQTDGWKISVERTRVVNEWSKQPQTEQPPPVDIAETEQLGEQPTSAHRDTTSLVAPDLDATPAEPPRQAERTVDGVRVTATGPVANDQPPEPPRPQAEAEEPASTPEVMDETNLAEAADASSAQPVDSTNPARQLEATTSPAPASSQSSVMEEAMTPSKTGVGTAVEPVPSEPDVSEPTEAAGAATPTTAALEPAEQAELTSPAEPTGEQPAAGQTAPAPLAVDEASAASPTVTASRSDDGAPAQQTGPLDSIAAPAAVTEIAAEPESSDSPVAQAEAMTPPANGVNLAAAGPAASKQAQSSGAEPGVEALVAEQPLANEPDVSESTGAPDAGSQATVPADQTGHPGAVSPPPGSIEIAAAGPLPSDLATAQSSRSADVEKAVIQTMKGWARAWSRQDVTAYLSFYSSEFVPSGGRSRQSWAQIRQRRITNPKWIKVQISDIDIAQLHSERLQMTFTQAYQSNRFTDTTRKQFILKKEEDTWVIVAESDIGDR